MYFALNNTDSRIFPVFECSMTFLWLRPVSENIYFTQEEGILFENSTSPFN